MRVFTNSTVQMVNSGRRLLNLYIRDDNPYALMSVGYWTMEATKEAYSLPGDKAFYWRVYNVCQRLRNRAYNTYKARTQ